VRTGQTWQDDLLHLEADDRRRIGAFADVRHLHQHRTIEIGMRDAPKHRHAATMHLLLDAKTVDG